MFLYQGKSISWGSSSRLLRLLSIGLIVIIQACSTIPESDTDNPSAQSESPRTRAVNSQRRVTTVSIPAPQEEEVLPVTDMWERIRQGLQLTDYYDHETVLARLDDYAGNQRFFDVVTERASPFLYTIVELLEADGLPLELALLPVIESTYDPNAYSVDHAVGLWQFLSSTGRSFGLQQDWWYDGRRDAIASSEAAISYLKRLHGQFDGDWLLALAAYNTGSPNMRRAIERSGSSLDDGVEFWDLRLARETRAHIPKLLAIAKIIQNPQAFGIELPPIDNAPQISRVEISGQIDLRQAAELADTDYELLRHLNAGFRQWATHPDNPQFLYVPVDKAEQLSQAVARIPSSELLTWDRYEIQPGDTLSGIASRLGTEVDVLRVVNRLSGNRIIAGRSLLIPRGLNGDQNITELAELAPEIALPATIPSSYRVQSGDNLWSIARRFQLRSSDIASHNGFSINDLLMPGQVLDLAFVERSALAETDSSLPRSAADYRVLPGDTMAAIAAKHGLAVNDLLRWNNFSGEEVIYPDQIIRIQPPATR